MIDDSKDIMSSGHGRTGVRINSLRMAIHTRLAQVQTRQHLKTESIKRTWVVPFLTKRLFVTDTYRQR